MALQAVQPHGVALTLLNCTLQNKEEGKFYTMSV